MTKATPKDLTQRQALTKKFNELRKILTRLEKELATGKRKCGGKCGKVRPLSDYYVIAGTRDGIANDCRFCRIEAASKRYYSKVEEA